MDDAVTEQLRRAELCFVDHRADHGERLLQDLARRCANDAGMLERIAAILHEHGRLLPALRCYDRVIELGSATASLWCATGNALSEIGEHAQAIGTYQHCLDLEGQHAEAQHNLGRALYRLGDVDQAAVHLQRSIDLSDDATAWMSLATMIPGCPGADHQRILDVRQGLARRLAEQESIERQPAAGRGENTRRRPSTRLRIGYLSAFFHTTNYMKPVWGLINQHDRRRVQLHLFCDSPRDRELTGYRPHRDDRLHHTDCLGNDGLRELIERQEIDVLVDLNAYSVPARLPLFLQPHRAICVAWFNMYATSGMPAFEYLIGDRQVVQRAEYRYYSEQILRLPLSYLTFEVDHPAPPLVDPPCVKSPEFTFGSLVAQYKIAPRVLDDWAEVLRGAENARLLLGNTALKSPCNRQYLLDQFVLRGVDPTRIELLGPAEHYQYLCNYDRIDVALDAYPYNGGTTTMEAMWQGVPVLTPQGDRWAGRTSQTLLRRSTQSRFVADDRAQLVRAAIELATSRDTPEQLRRLRQSAREQLVQSDACATGRFARHMERLYHAIWNTGVL